LPPATIRPKKKKKKNNNNHPQLLFKEIQYYCQGIWEDAVVWIRVSHYLEHFAYKIEKIGAWEVHVTTAEEQKENGRMLLHMRYVDICTAPYINLLCIVQHIWML